jgi:predicted DCC family thiol-disulfide oxidoreductase YuxK
VETLYVLYDGHCVLCTGTVRRLQSLPLRANLHYISLQTLEEEPQALDIPGRHNLDIKALYEKLHVIDESGTVYAGADSVVRLMRTLRGLGWISWLYAIPGMKGIANASYHWIAKHRYDWFGRTDEGCTDGACRLPANKGGETEHDQRAK